MGFGFKEQAMGSGSTRACPPSPTGAAPRHPAGPDALRTDQRGGGPSPPAARPHSLMAGCGRPASPGGRAMAVLPLWSWCWFLYCVLFEIQTCVSPPELEEGRWLEKQLGVYRRSEGLCWSHGPAWKFRWPCILTKPHSSPPSVGEVVSRGP